jgi:[acyl-carrier-protein] S-malonyltransferase
MQPLALLFPGQGSQHPGMAAGFRSHPATRELFQQADDTLGFALSKLMQNGPADELTQTQNAQPALLLAGYAALTYLTSQHPGIPTSFAVATGHSLGFYTAALAAGALDFPFALQLVRARGQAMGQVTGGGMSAILGLDLAPAGSIATQTNTTLANDNAPGQHIFSGPLAALAQAEAAAKAAGAKRVLRLPVSGPFHTPAMAPAAQAVAQLLAATPPQPPHIPLIANTAPSFITTGPALAAELTAQITARIRWREAMVFLADQGVTRCLELGAGKVLTGLAPRGDARLTCAALTGPDEIDRWLETSV